MLPRTLLEPSKPEPHTDPATVPRTDPATVMAAPVISISSDSSEQSVGSHAPMIALEEDSLPLAPELPLVLPFLCSDDSEDRVASRPSSPSGSSSHDTLAPSSEFPFAPIVAPSRIHRRRVSHRLSDHHSSPDFTSDSSSSGSSFDSSLDTSSGSPSDSLSDTSSVHSSRFDASSQSHSGPSTRVASSRLVYPSVITLRYSEVYPPTTSESSLDLSFERSLDSSSPSAGPSRKRCRSPTTLVPSSTLVLRSIALLLPDTLKHLSQEIWIIREDEEGFEADASAEEFCQIRRDHDDARMRLMRMESFVDMTITHSGMTLEAIEELVSRRVEEVLATYEATRAANALRAESQSQNGSDGNNGNGGNGNPNENGKSAKPVARVCTYQDFMKCQPLNFKGTEGVVGLTRCFEKMEIVLHISNCPEVYQVKYATCTLLDSASTWWNSHKWTIGVNAAFAMTWRDLMKLMTEVNCPRNDIQKIKTEL
ncbi:hypothetical protein Tco_0876765 [Tanacetum coccineum]|uniref:Retrotransposon gag domain-containing protein n=1 Tax=Tanacetum coccineum TaxID=301880 RepID=A0ABQ5BYH6_9ASTR